MLDVASLEKFDFLNNFVLAAGHNGLSRTISNVVILDHEGIDGDFSDFHEGDFVITNLLFAKNSPQKIYFSFEISFSKLANPTKPHITFLHFKITLIL